MNPVTDLEGRPGRKRPAGLIVAVTPCASL